MARGIMIFGGAGSGKTTLGRMTAQALGCAFFDLDDYIWRKDTAVPFTVMYTREEKIERLMTDVLKHERFVMAGSMSSFHEAFDSMFDGMIYLKTDTAVRLARLRKRERERYGDRILENGDLVEHHRRFLESASRYDTDGSPNETDHLAWARSLSCPFRCLDGADALSVNVEKIVAMMA